MKRSLFAAPAAFVVLFCGQMAQASLIGDSITISHAGNTGNASDVVIVGAGPEIQQGDGSNLANAIYNFPGDAIDVQASSIVITLGGSFNGTPELLTFSGLDWSGFPGLIAGANLVSTAIPSITQADISFTPSSISVDLSSMVPQFTDPNGRSIVIDIVAAQQIPEPATAALGLFGIGSLLLRRRRAA